MNPSSISSRPISFAWTLCVILLSFLLEKLVLRLISGGGKNA